MGFELEVFVYPDRISNELICPICHGVVEKPVQTPSEHLFCEDELLEWMIRSDICPVTHEPLDPDTIRRPGRIVSNMLAALERYCPNKEEGCKWQGTCDRVNGHLEECEWKPRADLRKQLQEKDILIALLRGKLSAADERNEILEERNKILTDRLEVLQKKVKVYDAFFKDGSQAPDEKQMNYTPSDASKLSKLRNFEAMTDRK